MQSEQFGKLCGKDCECDFKKQYRNGLLELQRNHLLQVSADRNLLGKEAAWTPSCGNDRSNAVAGEEGYNGIRNEDSSENSDDYDELESEAETGRNKRDAVKQQHQGQQPPEHNFERLEDAYKAEAVLPSQKLGLLPFFSPYSTPGAQNAGSIVCYARGMDSFSEKVQAPESLRESLSDPISGVLMDDAVILPCGHSVGSAGFQRVQDTSACVICFQQVSPILAAPNHALRTVVNAFKRDRECPLAANRFPKRRREDEQQPAEGWKAKGVQFPYSVSDRVLIKGNKRTPERFVGREAIITTQCLNGWYLVRTVDNGESVRLQYRSLQKIS